MLHVFIERYNSFSSTYFHTAISQRATCIQPIFHAQQNASDLLRRLQNTITANSTSVVPDIELTPFFSGIALDVTPQIDANGSILLHVNPSVIETEEQEKVVTLNEEQIVL